ncbi:T-box protein 3 [Sarotherodon galilaeus]
MPCEPSTTTRKSLRPPLAALATWILFITDKKIGWDGRTSETIPEITCVLSACHVRSPRICIAVGCRRNAQHTPRMYIRHGDKQTRCFRVFKPEKWEESKAAEVDLVMKLPSVAPGIFSPRESSSGSARK